MSKSGSDIGYYVAIEGGKIFGTLFVGMDEEKFLAASVCSFLSFGPASNVPNLTHYGVV